MFHATTLIEYVLHQSNKKWEKYWALINHKLQTFSYLILRSMCAHTIF